MNLQTHSRENEKNEDTKIGSHNHKERKSEEDNKDTLSDFPDCILLHILSFLNAIEAIQTSILSTRWKNLWKYLPTFRFYSHDFVTFKILVNQFLSLRDSSTELNCLDIELRGRNPYGRNPYVNNILERIVRYAASHNVNSLRLYKNFDLFPPSLFSCHSLTSLVLYFPDDPKVIYPNSLCLPALTYLTLGFFSFCGRSDGRVEPFSNLTRLETLILRCCIIPNKQPLYITNTELRNLTIYTGNYYEVYSKIELSTPNICSFTFTGNGSPILKLYGSSPFSMKQVSVDVFMTTLSHTDTPLILLNWLLELVNIKSLTIPAYTLQLLSLVPDLLKVKPPWFNLESLKITPGKLWKENANLREVIKARSQSGPYSSILDGMIRFFLQNSPSTKVDIVR